MNSLVARKKIYSEDIARDDMLAEALVKAKLVYVHSIYQAEKILLTYSFLADKIVTDLHGLVPEELEKMDEAENAKRLARVEKDVFQSGKIFVAVSQAMVDYYKTKYSNAKNVKWIILPIFSSSSKTIDVNKRNQVIYAGGAQPWQNVELMVQAVNKKYQDYEFVLLTHEPGKFRRISQKAKIRTLIKSVSSKEIVDYYKKSSLGFVLRDDSPINRVSCPTKLIEYLAHGVVPIVKSPELGDFNRLGYAYFKIDRFINKKISEEEIRKAAEKNKAIFGEFQKIIELGIKELNGLLDRKSARVDVEELLVNLIRAGANLENAKKEIIRIKQTAEYYELRSAQQEEITEHYHKALNDILQSRKWRVINLATSPLRHMRFIKK